MTAVAPPMPDRISRLPRDSVGRPIPWFVATLPDGTRDHRVADRSRRHEALRLDLCWVCGQANGAHKAFCIGPMCAVNKVTAEPPAHRDCAVYSAQACPFLTRPGMRRRTTGMPTVDEGRLEPPGEMILRNPGAVAVWMTRTFRVMHPPGGGALLSLGDPSQVLWFAQGRPATRAEVQASMTSGLPILREACGRGDNPAAELAQLDTAYQLALALLPAATGGTP